MTYRKFCLEKERFNILIFWDATLRSLLGA
jgi:hypothetical protein